MDHSCLGKVYKLTTSYKAKEGYAKCSPHHNIRRNILSRWKMNFMISSVIGFLICGGREVAWHFLIPFIACYKQGISCEP